jgi:hypothetical protein
MNTRELNFAYKVRHALNETTENLPSSTVDRLANARKTALSRKKKESALRVFVPRFAVAGASGAMSDGRFSWLQRFGLVVPLIVVAAGLTGIYHYEQQRHIAETAEIDAALLADELPLSAYVDHGFNAYLAKRGE